MTVYAYTEGSYVRLSSSITEDRAKQCTNMVEIPVYQNYDYLNSMLSYFDIVDILFDNHVYDELFKGTIVKADPLAQGRLIYALAQWMRSLT